jgi:hypothetical protein
VEKHFVRFHLKWSAADTRADTWHWQVAHPLKNKVCSK